MSKRKRATARKLKALSISQSKLSAAAKASANEASTLRSKVADLERQVVRARDNAKSITDMIGGLQLCVLAPDRIRGMRFEEHRLMISIMPELYAQSFLYGGGSRSEFRNFSAYVRMVGQDISYKIEKLLVEHIEKKTGGMAMMG